MRRDSVEYSPIRGERQGRGKKFAAAGNPGRPRPNGRQRQAFSARFDEARTKCRSLAMSKYIDAREECCYVARELRGLTCLFDQTSNISMNSNVAGRPTGAAATKNQRTRTRKKHRSVRTATLQRFGTSRSLKGKTEVKKSCGRTIVRTALWSSRPKSRQSTDYGWCKTKTAAATLFDKRLDFCPRAGITATSSI
jgi:hypothetical protein